jgi:hypothetical protein
VSGYPAIRLAFDRSIPVPGASWLVGCVVQESLAIGRGKPARVHIHGRKFLWAENSTSCKNLNQKEFSIIETLVVQITYKKAFDSQFSATKSVKYFLTNFLTVFNHTKIEACIAEAKLLIIMVGTV